MKTKLLVLALVSTVAIAPLVAAGGGAYGDGAQPTTESTPGADGPEEAVGPTGMSGTTLAILAVLAVVVIVGIVLAVTRRQAPP